MIKYKVKDAAADLGVSNKEIIEILEKHCGVTKKTMTNRKTKSRSLTRLIPSKTLCALSSK